MPFWSIFLLRAQITLVFFYSGLAKLDTEWLGSQPASRLLAQGSTHAFDALLRHPAANQAIVLGGIVVDLLLPVLLVVRRTRRWGFALAAAFLLTNHLLFPIGIFPALAMLTVLTFIEPRPGTAPPATGRVAPALVAVYLLVQALLPARAWLYPQPAEWSEEGQFFAWRMMRLAKHGTVRFLVRDERGGRETEWDPARDLTPIQIDSMSTRPMLVHQYARHIADEVAAHEGFRPRVYAEMDVAMGGHPPRRAVDPTRDLASEDFSLMPYDWIEPLE